MFRQFLTADLIGYSRVSLVVSLYGCSLSCFENVKNRLKEYLKRIILLYFTLLYFLLYLLLYLTLPYLILTYSILLYFREDIYLNTDVPLAPSKNQIMIRTNKQTNIFYMCLTSK